MSEHSDFKNPKKMNAVNRALDKDASEFDIRVALYMAKTLGIE